MATMARGSEAMEAQKSTEYKPERRRAMLARYVYGVIFLFSNLCAWIVRDYGQVAIQHFRSVHRNYSIEIKSCGAEGKDCFHTLGVLRVSFGCFIYFSLMLVTTFGTKKLHEARNVWHSHCWSFKACLLLLSLFAPFSFPSPFIQLYGELARVGAGIFLVLQLISVIQFINWWNNYWMPLNDNNHSCSLGLFMSTAFYIASICAIAYMFSQHGTRLSCGINIFFIAWSAVLLVVMMAISLHSKVNRGLLSSGIMASYIIYLCWSAIRSEPESDECNVQKHGHGSDWATVLGFLMAICAVVMATFSTGIDSRSFQFRKDDTEEDGDIPYNYGFFHLVFALGAMYFAMLFISWNLNNSPRRWSIDIGWASTWVKIINEWFAATVYLWTLISPIVRQSKVMNYEEERIHDSAVP